MKNLTLLFLLAGCVASTPAEREWNEAMDRENWAMCERALIANNIVVWHYEHVHSYGRDRPHWIRSDLSVNRCQQRMGEYWIMK